MGLREIARRMEREYGWTTAQSLLEVSAIAREANPGLKYCKRSTDMLGECGCVMFKRIPTVFACRGLDLKVCECCLYPEGLGNMEDIISYLCPICAENNFACERGGNGVDDKPGYCKRHPKQRLLKHSFQKGFLEKDDANRKD